MNTSIYITHYRNRHRNGRWRRGFRIALAVILLMCMLSACVVPVAAQAAGTDTSPEVTETVNDPIKTSDNIASDESIIAQNVGDARSADEKSAQVDDASDAAGEIQGPVEGTSGSVGDKSATAEGTPAPVEGVSGLVEETPGSVGEKSTSAEETPTPVEGVSGLVEETSGSVGEKSATAEGTPTPVEETAAVESSLAADAPALTADAPVLMIAAPSRVANRSSWLDDFDFFLDESNGRLVLRRYKYPKDPTRKRDITIYAQAVVNGVTYDTVVMDYLFMEAIYIRSVTFEDGVGLYSRSVRSMFNCCFNLESVDLGTLDTTGIEATTRMFLNCVNLKSLDVSMMDVSEVEHMDEMFKNCYRLESVNVSGWNTSRCYDMWNMFADCVSLKSLDLSSWNTLRATGYQMDGMFSVGLEELTVGANFWMTTDCEGLLGTWTDGVTSWPADTFMRSFSGGRKAGTYTRTSLGGGRGAEEVREQETLTLPEDTRPTTALTSSDKKDPQQRNGQISDAVGNTNGQLRKTAAWTDQDSGTAEIDLTYAVPSQGGARALFAFGTCNVHGFGTDIAVTQMLELLDQYDYVDAITTKSQYWRYLDQQANVLETAEKYAFTMSAADGKEANYQRLITMLTPDYSDPMNYNILYTGSHASGVVLLSYLMDYMAENSPAAVYVSFDGSRAFANDNSPYHRKSTMPYLYGCEPGTAALDKTYDDLLVDADIMQRLADYQQEGRYYVCICDAKRFQSDGYSKAFYRTSETYNDYHECKLLCYASFALVDPYTFVHNNEDLRTYLSGEQIKEYAAFRTVGKKIINYGASFTSQGVQYISAPLSITDIVDDGLAIDEENISVSVMLDGKAVTDAPDIQITVNGQNVRVYVSEVSIGEVVHVHIPVRTTAGAEDFRTEDNGFRNTNMGQAVAITAAGKTVPVDSPMLYKGVSKIVTRVENGTITETMTGIPMGEDREVTYAPREGYHLHSVTVDGAAVDMQEFESSYLFESITEDHEIVVVYTEEEEPDVPETPEDPVEPEIPDDDKDDSTHRTEHHKTVHRTTENDKTVNRTVTNETIVNRQVTTPAVDPETEEPPVAEEAGAAIATGDDAQMMLWLTITGVAALSLLGWIAVQTRRLY